MENLYHRWPYFDLRTATPAELRGAVELAGVRLHHVRSRDLPLLVSLGFPHVRALSLSHLHMEDLRVLAVFPHLEDLEIWQSEDVQSLAGLERVRGLRSLSLFELGILPTLEPIAALSHLEELLLAGGVWKHQKLACDLGPLAELRELKKLALHNVRGATDFGPLLGFNRLVWLDVATALFPVEEVARLAKRYPFWAKQRPWLRSHDYAETKCERCGGGQVLLLLRRKKAVWCPSCDTARLQKTLRAFEALFEEQG